MRNLLHVGILLAAAFAAATPAFSQVSSTSPDGTVKCNKAGSRAVPQDCTSLPSQIPLPAAQITGVVPAANIWQYGPPTPATVPTLAQATGGSLLSSSSYYYTVTFVNALGESDFNTSGLPCVSLDGTHNAVNLTSIPVSSDSSVTARRIYRSIGTVNCSQDPRGGWTSSATATPASTFSSSLSYQLLTTINDNTTTSFTDTIGDSSLIAATIPQGVNTAIPNWYRANDLPGQQYVLMPDGNSVAIGQGAMLTRTCYACAAVGINSLTSNTSGVRNTAIGTFALTANTTGSMNVAVGDHAVGASTTETGLTGMGFGALSHEAISSLYPSTAFGYEALYNENNSQQESTCFGYQACQLDSTGYNLTAIGFNVLRNNTSAFGNTAAGTLAMQAQQTGNWNTMVGMQAGYNMNGGSNNVCMGFQCLEANGTQSNNVAIGWQSGNLVTGNNNTLLGNAVGSTVLTSGSGNILIGTSSAVTTVAPATANEVNIGGALLGYSSTSGISVTSGAGTSPTIAGNGTFVFVVTEGATGTPSTSLVLGLPTAPTDWDCDALDRSSSTITGRQTGVSSATGVTFTFSAAPANADVIQIKCNAR